MIRRAAGLTLVVTFLLLWDADSLSLVDRLALPALLALGAWLALENIAAVALAVAALAAIHSDPGADDPIRGWVYPASACLAAITAAAIFGRRFAAHIRATRDARHAGRAAPDANGTD